MPRLVSYQRLKFMIQHRRFLLKWKQKCYSSCSNSVAHFIPKSKHRLSSAVGGGRLQCHGFLPSSFCIQRFPYSTIYDTFDGQPLSWLFVSDAIAGAYGAQVNLDLELDRFSSQEYLRALEDNLEHRQIHFDLDSLVSDFKHMTALNRERQHLDPKKEILLKQFTKLKLETNNDNQSLKKELERELKELKETSKDLLNELWSVEEKVMRTALGLPNDLHPSTPVTESTIVDERISGRVPSQSLSHVEIGKQFDLIKFSTVGPQAYYLKGELAHASRKLSDIACDHFLGQNYRLMSGPEFFKSPVMESCGLDVFNTQEVLTIKHSSTDIEPMTHLAGVSPMTFSAYVAKLCIGDSNLPLKMFSIGPRYQTGTNSLGLYGAGQSSQVAIFSCTCQEDLETQYKEMVDTVWNFLLAFGFSIRMTHCCASRLRREERRRTDMEIWAPSLNGYIPIANVSDVGDYISRRQMTTHNKNHADIRHTKLVHMVSGTAIDMTTLLAVWMEYSNVDSDEFSLLNLPLLSDPTKAFK